MTPRSRSSLLLAGCAVLAGVVSAFLPLELRTALGTGLALLAAAAVLLLDRGPALVAVLALVGAVSLGQVVLASVRPDPSLAVVPLALQTLLLAAGVGGAWLIRGALVRREEVLQDKDQLLASISHQLRTPLTVVVGFAELLRSGAEESSPEERRRMLADLSSHAFELSSLIDNLLVASRAELDQLEVVAVPVSLRSQLAQELEAWAPDALTDRRIEVRGGTPIVVGDPGRIRHILHNLVANAVRHGGGRIRIELDEEEGRGRVTVADDGPGIAPEVARMLFEPYTVSVTSVLPGPLGLGLAVARHLAQRMGGDVTHQRVESWTCFRLELPLAPGPAPDTGRRAGEM